MKDPRRYSATTWAATIPSSPTTSQLRNPGDHALADAAKLRDLLRNAEVPVKGRQEGYVDDARTVKARDDLADLVDGLRALEKKGIQKLSDKARATFRRELLSRGRALYQAGDRDLGAEKAATTAYERGTKSDKAAVRDALNFGGAVVKTLVIGVAIWWALEHVGRAREGVRVLRRV